MAYTNPQQWLDLLRSRPGTRMTDLGSNVLEATGPFLNRQSASPQSDWRSMMNEGDTRRQQSAAYGTPSAISGMNPGTSQPQTNIGQSVANLLQQVPGSKINDIGTSTGDGTENQTQDPQGFLGQLGSYLSRENTPELLLAAGGAMSQAASQPGSSFLGSLGAGTAAGVAQRGQQRTLEAARAEAAAEQAAALAETDSEVESLARRQAIAGNLIADMPDLTEEQREELMGYADSPQTLKMLEELVNPGKTDEQLERDQFDWYTTLSPEEQILWKSFRSPASTTFNLGDEGPAPQDPAIEGMNAWISEIYNGRGTIYNNLLPSLDNVDQTLEIVNDDDFEKISGFLRGNPIADAAVRFAGNPRLLAMIGTYERLGSDRALAILRNFTGAKSNFEFIVSEKMAAKDRSMTEPELRAMLELMRKAYIQEAVRWAQDMVQVGGQTKVTGQYAAVQASFMEDAQSILNQYGEEERSWRNSTDPLGINRNEEEQR